MPMRPGSASRSNSVSVVSTDVPSASSAAGTTGREPVAMMKAWALTRWPSTTRVRGPVNRAVPISSRSPAAFTVRWAAPAASMSRVARAWRHRLSAVAAPVAVDVPCSRSRRLAQRCPACKAALDGMQPTRAQVVPSGPWSISRADLPAHVTSWNAVSPAVPAPMMAMSVVKGVDLGISAAP
jgi:hypothetical protein